MARRNAYDRLRPLRRLTGPVEAAEVRWFGRSMLSTLYRTPVLVLETTGRRSGKRRRATLAYQREPDGCVLVVGGAGGQTTTPDWVANLRADPRAEVVVDRARHAVTATELIGPNRDAVRGELDRAFPRIELYERRSGRPAPVFRLSPSAP